MFTLNLRTLRPLRLCGRYSEFRLRRCRTGSFVVKFVFPFLVVLTTNDINHGKNDDPYAIDKMPVPREHLDVLGVRLRHVSAQAQDQDQSKQDQTDDHVTGMQADQRVEGRPEKISADRQVIFKD